MNAMIERNKKAERAHLYPSIVSLLSFRVYLFGPGTHCRCPSCTALPQDCQWGSGKDDVYILINRRVETFCLTFNPFIFVF